MLEREAHAVWSADWGSVWLSCLSNPYKECYLVITELNMPVMDGLEMNLRIRAISIAYFMGLLSFSPTRLMLREIANEYIILSDYGSLSPLVEGLYAQY